MEYFIRFENIVKRFGDFVALNHVSLNIPNGAFVTLLGPSGCGKTTLMRQLAGFSEPDQGDIFIGERRVNGLPPFARKTPLVFQEYALFPHMTVYENISYGLRLQKQPKAVLQEKVGEMLEMFSLKGLESRLPKELSGGQQQRVAFARALIMGQEILLLDEPLSNLDAKLRVEVRGELRQIQQKLGITTIYVTHDQDEALSMSDYIAVMRNGRIEQIGSPADIYFRPASRFVADFVGTVNLLDAVAAGLPNGELWAQYQGILVSPLQAGEIHPGEHVSLVARPEYLRLVPPDREDGPRGSLKGRILRHSFLGRVIQYWVQVGPDVLVVEDPCPSMGKSLAGPVCIAVDAQRIHSIREVPDAEAGVY